MAHQAGLSSHEMEIAPMSQAEFLDKVMDNARGADVAAMRRKPLHVHRKQGTPTGPRLQQLVILGACDTMRAHLWRVMRQREVMTRGKKAEVCGLRGGYV